MSRDRERSREDAGSEAAERFFGAAGGKKERRDRQLCRQAREALSEALASLEDDVLLDVWVVEVRPAPDASRLAVLVAATEGADAVEVLGRLATVAPYLRAEVAAAITRKRVPSLTFELAPAGEPDEP